MAATWRIYVRDRSLNREGEIETYERAEYREIDCDEGSWLVEGIPADDPLLAYLADSASLTQDAGVVFERDGVPVFSGPIKSLTYSDGQAGRLVTIGGIDDTGVLADRYIQPQYDGPPYTLAYDAIGPVSAEEAMQHYVHRHAGPGAKNERWIPGLTIGPFSGLGSTVTKQFRFTNLLVALQEIALAGDVRFTVVQEDDGTRTFNVYGRNDLRDRIRLSVQGGLLGSIVSSETAPSANYVYVMGKGELESRTIVEQGDAESIARYGRIETVVSYGNAEDAVELANALAKALEEGREDLTLAVEPLDDEDAQLYEDYHVGDRVTALTDDGREIECYVVEATVSLTASEGAVVTPVLATTRVAPSSRDAVRSLGQRLGHLERTNENGWSIGHVSLWLRPVSEIPAGFQLADGSGGLPDLRDRYLFGAGGAFDVGDTAGLALSGQDVTVNLQHSHTVPDHGHGPGTLAFPHTHSHSHAPGTQAFPHTHSHGHAGGTLAWPHDHSMDAHTHGPGSLTFSHTHTTNIDHNHASQASGGVNIDSTAVGHASLGSGTVDHHHNVDLPALGTSNVTSSGASSTGTGGASGSPSSSHTLTAGNGGTWTGATAADATAQTPGTATGTTATDATAQTPGAATGSTASVTGTSTGNALSTTQSVLMPLVGVLPIYRVV